METKYTYVGNTPDVAILPEVLSSLKYIASKKERSVVFLEVKEDFWYYSIEGLYVPTQKYTKDKIQVSQKELELLGKKYGACCICCPDITISKKDTEFFQNTFDGVEKYLYLKCSAVDINCGYKDEFVRIDNLPVEVIYEADVNYDELDKRLSNVVYTTAYNLDESVRFAPTILLETNKKWRDVV